MINNKLASTAGAFRAAHAVQTTGFLVWPTQSARDLIDDYIDGLIDGHLLLHGPFGTGKTGIAKMVPFALTGEDQIHADTLFLNASDTTTKAQVIPQIHNFAQVISFCQHDLRFVILDEADRMDARAQDALKGIMDKYGAHVRFLFTTNHHGKLDGGIKSRCHCVEIGECSPHQWLPRARAIVAAEQVLISDADLLDLIKMGDGSGRKIMQMLERFVARYHRKAA